MSRRKPERRDDYSEEEWKERRKRQRRESKSRMERGRGVPHDLGTAITREELQRWRDAA